jgi:hypothetical protein
LLFISFSVLANDKTIFKNGGYKSIESLMINSPFLEFKFDVKQQSYKEILRNKGNSNDVSVP